MKTLKSSLVAWAKALEGARATWCEERLKKEAEEKAFRAAAAKAAEEMLKARGLLEALVAARKEIAEALLTAGAAEEGPPLPIGFGEKPKKAVEELSVGGEAEAIAGGAAKVVDVVEGPVAG